MAATSEAAVRKQQDLQTQYTNYKNTLQSLAQKVGEIEQEIEEHRLVMESLQPLPHNRKCFRLTNGVLVERTIKEVLPALKTNSDGLKQLLDELMKQYKAKQDEMDQWKKKHNIQVPRSPISASSFTDWPTNIVMLGGTQQFGLWIQPDSGWLDLCDITCLDVPAYALGACCSPTIDAIGLAAGTGACQFVGISGWTATITDDVGEFTPNTNIGDGVRPVRTPPFYNGLHEPKLPSSTLNLALLSRAGPAVHVLHRLEFVVIPRALGVTNFTAIDPEMERTVDTFESQT
ncbi:hypothetical protein DV737_g1614, partial [Chaetothyriales sp. CBS 132003]